MNRIPKVSGQPLPVNGSMMATTKFPIPSGRKLN